MTDRSVRSPREERRAQEVARRRADALAAATAVFAEKGFYDAQITDIAAAAELSRASLYELFKGKEELYQEVIRTLSERMRNDIIVRVEAIDPPRDRILTLVDVLFECYEEHRDLLRIVLSETQGLPWRIHQNMRDPSQGAIRGFRDWVIKLCGDAADVGHLEGIDPEAVAMSLLGSVTYAAEHALYRDPNQPLTRLAPGVREVFRRVLELVGPE